MPRNKQAKCDPAAPHRMVVATSPVYPDDWVIFDACLDTEGVDRYWHVMLFKQDSGLQRRICCMFMWMLKTSDFRLSDDETTGRVVADYETYVAKVRADVEPIMAAHRAREARKAKKS